MRLLHIADVHLGHPFLGLGPGRGGRRRTELREALTQVVKLAQARKVDALCIAGDLYEREYATSQTGDFLRDTFAQLAPIPVLLAPGNRDYFYPGCLYDRVPWTENVHVFRDSTLSPFTIADGRVWGLAFVDRERHTSPLADFRLKHRGLNVGLFHAEVLNRDDSSPYGPLEPNQLAEYGLDFAMLGHLHAGYVSHEQRYAYPGSIEPLDRTESGPRWALLVDASHSGVRIEQIYIARRRVLAEELDVSEIASMDELRTRLAGFLPRWKGADVQLHIVGRPHSELSLSADAIADVFADADVDIDVQIGVRGEEDLATFTGELSTRGYFASAVWKKIEAAPDGATQRYWRDVLAAGLAAFRGQEVTLS